MTTPPTVRVLLRAELTRAMRARDRESVAVCRTALAALDNAEAVPIDDVPPAGAVEASAIGVGAAEAQRATLTPAQERAIVEAEIAEREAAAGGLQSSRPQRAQELLREAALLRELVTGAR